MSRTGKVAQLFEHGGEPALAIHSDDMLRRGLKNGDFIRVSSRRGELVLAAAESKEVRPGQVFLPMHWNNQFLGGAGPNALTLGAFDPVSKQPELKHAAVRVEKLDLPWKMVAMASGKSALRREALQPLLARFDYASCVPFGRERDGMLFRAASRQPADPDLLARIDEILGLMDENESISYLDARRGISKSVRIHEGELIAVRLCGEIAACDWLKDAMAGASNMAELRRWVLAPMAQPPAGFAGRVVACTAMSLNRRSGRQWKPGPIFRRKAQLKCGAECGSCLPEIRRMLMQKKQSA